MEYDLIIGRYGEVGLKSPRVRGRFERKLVSNIKAKLKCEIRVSQARFYISPENFEEGLEKLDKIFGIVSYSPAISLKTDLEEIDKYLTEYVGELEKEGLITSETPFAIRCRRVGTHEMSSQEFAAYAGGVVIEKIGAPVNLSNPEITIYLEVREDETYIYHKKIPGPGGLPLGSQGRLVALISSGIDSPVAAYLMMKRGCAVTAIHFNNDPFSGPQVTENFNRLIDQLNEYSSGYPIRRKIVKYGEYLQKAKDEAPEKLTCVLCKSGMYKIASEVAKKEKALGIIDGSSVGQVASQTLPNILATRENAEFPILSPLIGLDKVEIEKIAKKIGTFPISELNDGGCSAVPKYPETNADLGRVHESIEAMDQDAEVKKVIDNLYPN
ncbi:tRNA uracil 4-sulfurtransferase ThiI [Methanobrevibacter filiformis]|uniref:Probable tRNA sulfurtransferase n=1 Tax=Methanobrevibacter filiformis TaxID=55758 RepID=A0A166FI57_9EURY|nr:tRNA uracil 4-sulfurtransferase ThiI [Methanobrevibacter filiformis]KZX17698.1 putative tRNA sulfurtransferase [Methanobrevibacter filiformis]